VAKKQLTEGQKKALEMEKKIEQLIHLEAVEAFIWEKAEALKDELRLFVRTNFNKTDKKGRKIWQSGIVKAILALNPQYAINKDQFVAKVGLEKAAKYMNISRAQVLAGIEAKELPLTFIKLRKIEKVDYGKEKVTVGFVFMNGKAQKFLEGLEKEE